MNFSLSEEHKMIKAAARDFAQKAKDGVVERDTQMAYPTEIVKEMGELGFYGNHDFPYLWWKRDGHTILCFGYGRIIKD